MRSVPSKNHLAKILQFFTNLQDIHKPTLFVYHPNAYTNNAPSNANGPIRIDILLFAVYIYKYATLICITTTQNDNIISPSYFEIKTKKFDKNRKCASLNAGNAQRHTMSHFVCLFHDFL